MRIAFYLAKKSFDEGGCELSPIFGDGLMGQAAANMA
jgi:hypothetical protein